MNKLLMLLLLLPMATALEDKEIIRINSEVITLEETNTTSEITIILTNLSMGLVVNETGREIIPLRLGGKLIKLNLSFIEGIKREIAINQEARAIISPTNASIKKMNYSNNDLTVVLEGHGLQEILVYSETKPEKIKRDSVEIGFDYANKIINFTIGFSTPTITLSYPKPTEGSSSSNGGGSGGGGGGGSGGGIKRLQIGEKTIITLMQNIYSSIFIGDVRHTLRLTSIYDKYVIVEFNTNIIPIELYLNFIEI
mgnify:CR=1 FL=1